MVAHPEVIFHSTAFGSVTATAPGSGSVLGPPRAGGAQHSSRKADLNEAAAAADASARGRSNV